MHFLRPRQTLSGVKATVVTLLCLAFACLPATGLYLLWSWLLGLVPATFAYAWAAKVAISLGVLVVGGGATFALTILFGVLATAVAVAILE